MWGKFRFGFRVSSTVLFCFLMWIVATLARLATFKQPQRRYRINCWGMSAWGYGIARLWGMRIRVEGHPPKAPFFLVSNHVSYTDILLLCAVSPGWFISKAEVASWPGIGPLTRSGNTIYINREIRRDVHRMNQLIADLIRQGGGIGFYPEGTTSDGSSVMPFKPSLLQPAVDLGIPVTPAAIVYETRPGAPAVAWIGNEAFAPHAKRLLSGPGFTARVRFGEQTYTASDRKELARITHAAVLDLHRQLRGQ